ncbi:PDZ domain-containing protein [Pseudoduganella namucuonensis]|nr:PDZ domain-containing protein [Pseudoduganella namucuonensis]
MSFLFQPALAETIKVDDVRSLQAALVKARVDKRITRIELATGTYSLPTPIVLDEGLSGTHAMPFVLARAPGAHPVLTGAENLPPLSWQAGDGGIWRAKLSDKSFQRLWLGRQMLIRARYPNHDPAIRTFGGVAADATSKERVATWRDPAGAVLHALHGGRWGGVHVPILGKNSDGSLRFGAQTANNRIAPPSANARYVENVFEELDAPGEWFHDRGDGWIYYKPLDGKRPPALGFRAGRLESLVRIEGKGAPANNIRIEGLSFRDTEPTFLKATEPLLRSDWKFYRVGAVTIENASAVTVSNSDFSELGGNAIVVSGRASHVRIAGNHLRAIGGTAIAFVGRPEAVRSPLFEYQEQLALSAIDRTPGPRSDQYPRDSMAEDNLIHDIGLVDKQAAGVEIAMAARISIAHNSIYQVPRAGINVGDGTWGGHQITYNDVFDTVLETGDHGAFNSWGRDRYWHPDRKEMDSRVAAEPSLATLDAIEPIVMRRNRFKCDHGWDIDLDDGASNYVIEENLMLSGGLKLREGVHRVVRNNILVNGSFHPHVWFENSADVFENNIVMAAHQPIGIKTWGKSVDRNLFANAADLEQARAAGTDANSVAGALQFTDPAHGDFRVGKNSPALALGFVNFPMSQFGVRPARLKALAKQPGFPELQLQPAAGMQEKPRTFLGLTIKSIETLGEQSAAGLLSKQGVLVLSVDPASYGDKAGLRPRDVVIGMGNDPEAPEQMFTTATALVSALQARRFQAYVDLVVVRDQKRKMVKLQVQ